MYTTMGFKPKNSLLLIDEGSAHPSSSLGSVVAITSFSETKFNSRKANAQVTQPQLSRVFCPILCPIVADNLHSAPASSGDPFASGLRRQRR